MRAGEQEPVEEEDLGPVPDELLEHPEEEAPDAVDDCEKLYDDA